jgi:cholesterol oxidase
MLPAGALLTGQKDAPKSIAELLADTKSAAESMIGGAYTGAVHKTQVFLAVGHDSAGGEIELHGEDIAIRWPHALDEPVFQSIHETLAKLVKATGGTYIANPASAALLGGNLLTVHPLGGCGMGATRADGVVDHKCRVFDGDPTKPETAVHEGLNVCDGSIMPRSLGVHPLLTITAMAERALLLFARDQGLTLDAASKADAPERNFVADATAGRARRSAATAGR